jgi:hypothetical protein
MTGALGNNHVDAHDKLGRLTADTTFQAMG